MPTAGTERQSETAVDKPEQLKIANALVRILVPSRATAGLYTICEAELKGDGGVPRHSHTYEDLFFYVVQGEFEVEMDQCTMRACHGASVFIPRQTPYSLRAVSSEPGRLLVFAQPGGLDLLFRDAATPRRGSAPGAILEKHGILPLPEPVGGK